MPTGNAETQSLSKQHWIEKEDRERIAIQYSLSLWSCLNLL